MVRSCTPTLTLNDVIRAGGKVADAIIRWSEDHPQVASGTNPAAEASGMTQSEYALSAGALEYIDADDGRAIGQVAPTDDTPEDEILWDIGGTRYLVGEWTDESVVRLEVPTLDKALEHVEIVRHMSDVAERYHFDQSDVSSWCELIETIDEILPIVKVLQSHGHKFSGNHVGDTAAEWSDHGMDADEVDAWCEAGVWDAGIAELFQNRGVTPQKLQDALQNWDDAEYPEPIESACNGDMSMRAWRKLVAAAKRA